MTNPIFSTIELSAAAIDLFTNTYNTLNKNFQAKFNDSPDIDLKQFECFKNYPTAIIRTSIELTKANRTFSIAIVSIDYTLPGAKKHGGYFDEEYQAWGFTTLNNHFGHVLLEPETFQERLLEMIQHIELNFEDDNAFNKRFYVLATDKA